MLSFIMAGQQEKIPIIVHVALLPSKVTAETANEPVPSEFQTSVAFINDTGDQLCASEYTKYLVEEACVNQWLLPLIEHAGSTNGVLKLCYGCGFETTFVVGNANAHDTPAGQLALGITVNRCNATVNQIGNTIIPASETIWNYAAALKSNEERACLYVRSASEMKYMVPPLPEEEVQTRRRMVRVWPAADDPKILEKMEELPNPQVATVARGNPAAVASRPGVPAVSIESPRKPSAAVSRSVSSLKKRTASTDVTENEPKKMRAKKAETFACAEQSDSESSSDASSSSDDDSSSSEDDSGSDSGSEAIAYIASVRAPKKRRAKEMASGSSLTNLSGQRPSTSSRKKRKKAAFKIPIPVAQTTRRL